MSIVRLRALEFVVCYQYAVVKLLVVAGNPCQWDNYIRLSWDLEYSMNLNIYIQLNRICANT